MKNEVIVIGTATRTPTASEARKWMGFPVCVVLKDGSYYVGWITEVQGNALTLSGKRGRGKLDESALRHAEKLRVSGWFPQLPGIGFGGGGFPFGNAAGGRQPGGGGLPGGLPGQANAGGAGGIMGMLGKAWPGIKMGFGMLRMIMPLLGGLKI